MGSLQAYNDTLSEGNPHPVTIAIRLLWAAQSFNQLYTPLLCLFGAVGNTLSVTVFCRTSTHRSLSASFYLSALAISDIGYLCNLLAVWLEDVGFRVITLPVTCPLVMYLGQVTCFLSVWFIVAFTMERFFAVCYPLTRPTVCTVARAKKVITILTIISLIGFSYVWVIARVLNYPMERPSSSRPTSTIVYDDVQSQTGFNNINELNSPGGPMFHDPHHDPPFVLTAKRIHNGTSSSSASVMIPELTLDPIVDDIFVNVNSSSSSSPPPIVDYISVCSVRAEHVYFSSIASHIDSVLTLILPFGIISYLNVRIAVCVWKLKDQRENLVAMAKISRQNSHSGGGTGGSGGGQGGSGRTHVGFVYRASKHHIHHRRQSDGVNHMNGTNNWRSKQNLTVDFEPNSESGTSTTSTSVHCCSEFSSRKLKGGGNNNQQLHAGCGGGGGGGGGGRRARKRRLNGSSHAAAETRVTKTLLLVSTVFLTLNLPSHAIRATNFIQSFWELKIGQEALFAAQLWSNILFNINFSVNFLLYCLSGRNFRQALKSIFKCNRSHLPRYPKNLRRSCSPSTYGKQSLTRSPSMTRTRESFYPVTEMETYA